MPAEPALKNPLGYLSSGFNDKEFEFFMKAHAWRFEKALRSVSYADAFLLAKAVDAVMERLRACRRDSWIRTAAARDDFEDRRNEARGKNAYKLRLQRFFDAGLFEPVVFEDMMMMEGGECPRAVLRLAAMSQGYYAVGKPDGEDDEYADMISDMEANASEAAGESDTYFDDYVAEELDVAEIFREALKRLILDGGVKRPEDFKKCVDEAWKAWEDQMKDEYRHYRRQAYGD